MDSPTYLSIILTFRSVQSSPQSLLHILILRIFDLVIKKNLTVKVQREVGPLLHQLLTYTRLLTKLRRTLEGPLYLLLVLEEHQMFQRPALILSFTKHLVFRKLLEAGLSSPLPRKGQGRLLHHFQPGKLLKETLVPWKTTLNVKR
ncbi:hypothetical protein TSUD_381560 [Trifolium subterraneum]|uniref:Uncharacterized protein n=1 Tax=Trifolium subterraneum TaxID=3900 RepID=A0A2Z6LQ05_TRISU|nr:hypothetical protein TSUD_381560 [Trifolium subterraneum]